MSDKDGWAISAIAVCTLLNFLLSLADTALNSLRSSRLQQYAQGRGDADIAFNVVPLQALLHQPTRFVAAVQTSITVLTLSTMAIAVAVLSPDVAHIVHTLGVNHNVRVTVILLVALISLVTLVFGQTVPRAVALRNPEQIALLVAQPLRWLELLERPLVAIVLGIGNAILRPFGLSASFNVPVITEEELKTLLDTSQRQGVIEADEKEMLRNVISFGDTEVHSVMTHRIYLKAAPTGALVGALIKIIVASGHSRIPIYENSIDNIVGIVLAKDLLVPLAENRADTDVRSLMRAPYFVPENKRVDELLEEFRRSNLQMAVVQDEYSGTAGLVTIEDLLEEIVGEIQDEYDLEEQQIILEGDGIAVADGRTTLTDINQQLGLALPTADYDTIGGFVFGLFGRPPQAGEVIDDDGVRFTVTEANGRRVQRVRVEPVPAETSEAEEVDAAPVSASTGASASA